MPFLNQFNQFSPGPQKVVEVWSRLLRPDRNLSIPIKQSHLPKSLIMSTIYMLHVETTIRKYEVPHKEDGSEGIDDKRREALKRFAKWVQCQCKYECGNEWNFVNEVGLRRPKDNGRKCGVGRILDRGVGKGMVWNLFEGKNLDAVEKSRKIWNMAS